VAARPEARFAKVGLSPVEGVVSCNGSYGIRGGEVFRLWEPSCTPQTPAITATTDPS